MFSTWWIKIIVKIILSRIPIKYQTWKKLGFFVHGRMNNADYAFGVFNRHYSKVKKYLSENYTLCELGAGDSIATSLIAPCFGASKTYLVDNGDFVSKEIIEYKELNDLLRKKGLNSFNFNTSLNFSELLHKNNSHYYTNGLNDLQNLKENSVDFIFSQATLEHIAVDEFRVTQEEIYRILKPNGIVSHTIDLRDHLNGGLNNLRFSKQIWESNLMSKSGFYTNRIRYSDMINIFEETGFKVSSTIIEK